ncbi:MAG: hypothetical protein ACJ73N_14105 [Bryobacteraceae bacterium]
MDVKQYFRKMREIEVSLTEPYPVVVSLETSDGGKAGAVCEVPRSVAAKMILERRATLASIEQKELFFQQQETARKAAEKAELARRVQVAIIADPDLQATTAKTVSKK